MRRRVLISMTLLAVVAIIATAASIVRERARARRLELLTILGDADLYSRKTTGRWSVKDGGRPFTKADEKEIERLARLGTLPYLQGYETAPAESGVTTFLREKTYSGINLFVSGHAQAGFAMDMEGRILHEWSSDIEEIWPEVPKTVHSTFWRRAHWYPDGSVLAVYEGIGLVKLDKDSRLLWTYRGGCHHQAFVAEDGRIYVLTRRPVVDPRINPDEPVLMDAVQVLTPEGEPVEEYSIIESFRRSNFRLLLRNMKKQGDIFHTNSIFVFDGSMARYNPLFKRGNIMISIRNLDIIAIMDPGTGSVVWAESGGAKKLWSRQHDPRLLANGRLLIFDNLGNEGGSKVMEYDIRRRKTVWTFDDDGSLLSKTCGTNQRLPNGNTLIAESDRGRALEVTLDGEIVWEFYNPNRAGEGGRLIATLFDMVRVDEEYFPWLKAEDVD